MTGSIVWGGWRLHLLVGESPCASPGARFPGRYIQAPGLLARLGAGGGRAGPHPRSCVLERRAGGAARTALWPEGAGEALTAICRTHGGECSEAEIAATVAEGRAAGADLVIGIGGGKTPDTAKAAAHALGLPTVVVPTIAASDAPLLGACRWSTGRTARCNYDLFPAA